MLLSYLLFFVYWVNFLKGNLWEEFLGFNLDDYIFEVKVMENQYNLNKQTIV